jgi:fucose permease
VSEPAISLLYAGFLLTGALTVLPGVLLPRVAAMDHLRDVQSGTLLLTQFAASACGALFVRRHFAHTVVWGYLLISMGALVLPFVHGIFALPAIATFGLGLGMAMTSTSLLVGRLFPNSRAAALSLLNFCWSAGAVVCPLAVARMAGTFSLSLLCVPVALLSGVFVAVPLLHKFASPHAEERKHRPQTGNRIPAAIVQFAAIGFLYVGVEATVGGWISTYTVRVTLWKFAGGNLAAACFWGAVLLGRGFAPVLLRRIPEQKLHTLATFLASMGIVLLLAAHDPWMLMAGACCTGVALAPIFPLTISLFIGRGETAHAGWVFAIAGFGGAVIPWLTGLVSTAAHSLRAGLLVALFAALAMLLLTLHTGAAARSHLRTVAAGA